MIHTVAEFAPADVEQDSQPSLVEALSGILNLLGPFLQ